MNWRAFVERLDRLPRGTHRLRPACTDIEIASIEREVGQLPANLRGLLGVFSGGELFCTAMPMVTVFGAPHPTGQSKVEWPSNCWLPVHVKSWRKTGGSGWPFAMTNYGGFFVLDETDFVHEFSNGDPLLIEDPLQLSDWADRIVIFGSEYLNRGDS